MRMLTSKMLAIGWAVVLGTTVSGLSHALVVVDQDNLVTDNLRFNALSNGTDFGRAQTFTVGVAGTLDSVQVLMDSAPTSMRILATNGTAPLGGSGGSTVLATSTVVSSLGGNTFSFDFSGALLSLSVGDVLAIEPLGITGFPWRSNGTSTYSLGGDYFFNTEFGYSNWTESSSAGTSPMDNAFRTLVNTGTSVPEPASLALVGLGLAGLAARRRRNQ